MDWPSYPRIVEINPFVGRAGATLAWAMHGSVAGRGSTEIDLPPGKFSLAEQAHALVVQTFPATPGIHYAEKFEAIGDRNMPVTAGMLHEDTFGLSLGPWQSGDRKVWASEKY